MDEREFYETSRKVFKRILDADIIAGDFAEKAGLEEHLKSTREVAKSFEHLIPEPFRGVFNLLMCYSYKPFRTQPGIARFCDDQVRYFLDRVRSYGIEIPEDKQIEGRHPGTKQITGD